MTHALKQVDLSPSEIFAAQYMGHVMTNPCGDHHRRMYRMLDDDTAERTAIEVFRAGGKSTTMKNWLLRMICESDYDEIQLFSASGGPTGLSTKWMRHVRREIESNALMTADYGLQRGQMWGSNGIEVIRGDGHRIAFYSRGKHETARGNRGLVIIDDPQDEDSCRSETMLARDEDWYFGSVVPILIPGQRLVFIGTAISPFSLLSKVKKIERYQVLECPLEDPPGSGQSVWPEQFPNHSLIGLREEMGARRYSAEYLLRPEISGNPVFRAEWVQSYTPDENIQYAARSGQMYVVVGFDGAVSKRDSADRTAVVALGVTLTPPHRIYCLEAYADRWTVKQGVQKLYNTSRRWNASMVRVESTVAPPHKDAVVEEIDDVQRIEGVPIPVEYFKPRSDKVSRAHVVQPLVENGQLFLNMEDLGHQELFTEMIRFTGEGTYHDDRVDALVAALTVCKRFIEARKSTGPASKIVRPQPSRYGGFL